jgi:lysine/ornithine N-monooxygenase
MLMYLVKKNKDEGEIENDYNDDEDCENCIRMDDANTHTHTHTQTWLSISCNWPLLL